MEDKNKESAAQPQTPDNPAGEPISNPFDNNRSVDDDIQQAGEELEKEQQFKEAQRERD